MCIYYNWYNGDSSAGAPGAPAVECLRGSIERQPPRKWWRFKYRTTILIGLAAASYVVGGQYIGRGSTACDLEARNQERQPRFAWSLGPWVV
jgi:hypothetical protein